MRFVSYMTPGFPASLFEAVADAIDAELHFDETTSGPAPGDDPFADGRFDLGWICSTSFVDLSLRRADPSVQLAGVAWVPDDPDVGGRPVYFGDIVVRAGSGIRSFADLEGRTIACNDIVSLSGHHALLLAIEHRGFEPSSFADLVFTGGHHNSLDQVVGGEVDAAVVDSVVRIGRARHDPSVDALALLDRLGPWPVQPLVARSGLAAAEVAHVRDTLLAASRRGPIADELRAAALADLVPVGPDHYEPVHQAFR